jgi:hypothetical protein
MVKKSLDNVPKINQSTKNKKLSNEFLPTVFRTNTNRRFLNATVDQLIQEPRMTSIYGYIGRQDISPNYKPEDAYVRETESYSQFYQLEPGLVINQRIAGTNRFKKTNAYNYVDLLNGIALQGGINTDHSRLFSNEYYNYEGFVDLDKLINYSKYYWVPTGPKTLEVNGYNADQNKTEVIFLENLTVRRPVEPNTTGNAIANKPVGLIGYQFDQISNKVNPTLNLVRGRTYTFDVDQLGHSFWIQTEPGLGEGIGYQENIFKREVYGVDNNGAEIGKVTFRVPFSDEQYGIETLSKFTDVDLVTDIAYTDIQGVSYEEFIKTNTIDGTRSLTTKKIVMINKDPASWGDVVEDQRYGIWQLQNNNGILNLAFVSAWPTGTKIFVKEGRQYGNVNVVKNSQGIIFKEPYITAKLDTLYYQDGVDASVFGEIRLINIDPEQATINIETRVLNQSSYTSPNNVEFTNGLKVVFRGYVQPTEYAGKEYVVEGVGTGIKLIPWDNLITPDPNNPNLGDGYDAETEAYDTINYDLALNAPLRKDYVVINRASIDGNAWSRTNRWFHEDVIRYASTFNNPTAAVVLDNAFRGIRPIIEFDANLQLFNHGNKFAGQVTAIDTTVTDIANQVEGYSPYVLIDSNGNYFSDNVALENGTYVIFTQERYENTKGRIYQVSNIIPHVPAQRTKLTTQFAPNNTTLLHLNDVSYLYINMKVSGTGILPNTVIKSIDSINSIVTLSQPVVDVTRGTTITFDSNNKQVHLIPVHDMVEGETVVAVSGAKRQNYVYWWHNGNWQYAQQKTSLNQAPLFDIFTLDGISFGNGDYYPSTTFAGSKLFGYREGTGTRDSELGFPLSFRSIGNIGDIVFENYYDTEQFHYSLNQTDQIVDVSTGYAHENNPADLTFKLRNNWIKIKDFSKQYIQKKFIASDAHKNNFLIDVKFNQNSQNEKSLFVYVNGTELTYSQDYTLLGQKNHVYVSLNSDLTTGDVLVVRIFGTPNSSKEIYTLPKNLTDNSLNETFTSLTLGQIRNHLVEIADNSLLFKGEAAGVNNFRDIDYKRVPGRILQHSAGVHIAQLFFNNETTNIVKAIEYSRKAYRNFKNQFFSLLSSMEFDNFDDPRACLDQLFDEISFNATMDQSFYYTDMLPVGSNSFTFNEYLIADTNYKKFNVINTFDIQNPNYRSVLVYQKKSNSNYGVQLLKDTDYTFDGYQIDILTTLDINDNIIIYEYESTKGCMVPATPTKLGLYPKFTPGLYLDDTYLGRQEQDGTYTRFPRPMIQGHDGSKIAAFNDFRDAIIVEFEQRVYNNLNVEYINDPAISFNGVEPGAFRNTEYSMDEWTRLLSGSFLEWAGSNSVDVFNNLFTNNARSNDPFSFNYSQGVDAIYNEGVPGYWRGIYKYFFDTDRPHTHPWEMFGFSQKPAWWEARYGAAPYTSGNEILWKDAEVGLIYQHGYDAYIDSRYARPGATKIIPVDEHGTLLAPISSVVINLKTQTASSSWRFGDQSPQETAWRRSSDYPYSIIEAWALAKPAQFCTWSLNRHDLIRVDALDQIINPTTGKRNITLAISDEDKYIPGSNIWLRDRLAGLNIDVQTNFVEIFENLGINLVYKMSSYTDKNYIEVIAEQASPNSTNSGIIVPKENYDIVLTKSAPVGLSTYSAVIIKKSGGVFSVYGSDNNKPYFTIIPRKFNGNFYNIKVSQSTAIVRVDDEETIDIIPYGQQFTSKQQIVDFLISYGAYLQSIGFTFGTINPNETEIQFSNSTRDWANSSKQFLYWTEQGWDDSVVISLTPAGTQINFNSGFGVVDDLTNSYSGVRLSNSDDRILQTKEYSTFREGTNFNLVVRDQTKGIHLVDLYTVAYEHTLVFDNVTVFNDIIYQPNLGNRQYRMKVNGFKTRDWDGSLYAPGFLVNHRDVELWQPITDYYKGDIVEHKNAFFTAKYFIPGAPKFKEMDWLPVNSELLGKKLIPNMAFNAQQFENFYDVDTFDVNSTADMQARNSTGFVPRNYLDDLGLNTISQHKFYLGMIREKGTNAVLNAFLRAKLPYVDNNVSVTEQYAVRLASYGGINDVSDVELSLANSTKLNGSIVVEFIDNNETKSTLWNSYRPKDLLIKPANYDKNFFSLTESYPLQVGTGGPVLPQDVDTSVFDIQKIYNLSMGGLGFDMTEGYGEGSRIWVASDLENKWNVYRLCGNENIVITSVSVINNTNELEFTTDRPHGLKFNDNILIKKGIATGKISVNMSGFYRINSVGPTVFRTPIYTGAVTTSGKMNAMLYKLKSVRYQDRTAFSSDLPPGGWKTGDKAWINGSEGNWELLNLQTNYFLSQTLTPIFSGDSDNFGNGISMKSTEDVMAVGAPGKDSGAVYIYNKNYYGVWSVSQSIIPENTVANDFGFSVNCNDKNLVITGAPASNSNKGLAYVLKVNNVDSNVLFQVLNPAGLNSGDQFGYDVTSSQDGTWVAVSAPSDNTVYIYKFNKISTPALYSYVAESATEFELPSILLGTGIAADAVKVYLNERILIPSVEYSISGNNVELSISTNNNDVVNIVYEDYYKLITSFSNTEAAGSFGYSIDFNKDGTELAIGAPYLVNPANSNSTNFGAVYLFERTIETFITPSYDKTTLSSAEFASVSSVTLENTPVEPVVYVNGELDTSHSINGKVVTFTNGNLTRSVGYDSIVTVESNTFRLLETKRFGTDQANLYYGSKVKICPTSCSLYVGAKGYNVIQEKSQFLNNGAVVRYVNEARSYGTITTQKNIPTVTGGHSIRINGMKITFTGTNMGDGRTIINWTANTSYLTTNFVRYNSIIYKPTQNFTSGSSFSSTYLTPYRLTIDEIVADINAVKIPGITATKVKNMITISSDSMLAHNKIIINTTDLGTALDDLGLTVFKYYQFIGAQSNQSYTNFGNQFTLDASGNRLLISATQTDNIKVTTFDKGNTTFDAKSTRVYTATYRSGSAYLYEYQGDEYETPSTHGNFAYAQTFNTSKMSTNDYFGTGIALTKNWAIVTALGDGTKAGTVYTYQNKTGAYNWNVERSKLDPVDSRKIARAYLYNDNTKELIADLPVIDPEHGIPVPEAAEQLKYIVNYDPAVYTNSPNTFTFAVDVRSSWAEEHVGQLWWDTNQIKYAEWNQGDLITRFSNWGLSVPNSFASVYEWIESSMTPSEWNVANPTTPSLYTAGEVYSIRVVIDPVTLAPTNKYYFWVANSNANYGMERRDSAIMLQDLIANPRKNDNQPFISVIGTNAIALFNCQDLVDNDTRLHITMHKNQYVNPVHTEWTMFDDGSDLGIASEFLDRLNDSLAGIDNAGKIVPDLSLSEKQRYGLEIRPRQTTFVDNFSARNTWISNVNAVFARYPMVLLRETSILESYDLPPEVDGTSIKLEVSTEIELTYLNKSFYNIGDKILIANDSTVGGWSLRELAPSSFDSTVLEWKIVKVKSYDLRDYWTYSDWYSPNISRTVAVDKIVDYDYEIADINPLVGQIIKVKNGTGGNWKLVLVRANSLELVAQQNSTIQLTKSLYDNISAGFGIDNQSFEIKGFAKDNALEFRKIFDITVNKLLNKELRAEFKSIMTAMFDDITTQFKQNDWLMKTSLVNVKNEVRSLNQIPVYVKENADTVLNFIEEVKPFHTKVKEYINSYNQLDLAGFDTTDFDLPSYFNKNTQRYRQPQLKKVYNEELGRWVDTPNVVDTGIWYIDPLDPTQTLQNTKAVYQPWIDNHKYQILYVDLDNAGTGYKQNDTTVVIRGDGRGATAEAFVKNGSIYAINVTNTGYNYTYATIEILGSGTGATAYAKLGNGKARTFSTTIKFDRFTYQTSTKEWAPNTSYSLTDLITYNGSVYRLATDTNLIDLQSTGITTGDKFSFDNLIELVVKVWEPHKKYAKDTIIVYNHVPYVALTDFTSGRYFEYNTDVTVTNSISWQPATYYAVNTVVSYNGVAYKVISNFTSPNSFTLDNLLTVYDIAKYPGGYFDDAASRVWSYYNPKSGMPGKDLAQVMSGVEYPGVNVIGPTFDQKLGFGFELYERIAYDDRTFDENGFLNILGDQAIDTNLYSTFKDNQLGIRPEDMITDGASYVDTYNSYAPEEFVPGLMMDSLDIRVKTLTDIQSFKSPDIVVVSKYADDITSTFSFDPKITDTKLPVGGIEELTVVNDIAGLQIEGVDYTVDWKNQSITFFHAPAIPSAVFIVIIGASGQKIIADAKFIGDGETTEFEIVDSVLENVQQAYVKVDGEKVTNWSLASASYGSQDYLALGFGNTGFEDQYWDQNRFPVALTWQPLHDYFTDEFVSYGAATFRVVRPFTSKYEFDTDNLISASRTFIRFLRPPAKDSVIQIHLFDLNLAIKAYSEIVNQEVVLPSDFQQGTAGFEIKLQEPVQYLQPWEARIDVTVNGLYLEPTNQAYYSGNGKTKNYSLPKTRNVDVNVITNSDIVAIVDGVVKLNPSEYTVFRNGIDVPVVQFNTAPAEGSKIIISNKSTSNYYVYNEDSILIKPSYPLFPNDKIKIKIYSNHDQYDTRSQVFSAVNNNETSVQVQNFSGWDSIAYDSVNYVEQGLVDGTPTISPFAVHHRDVITGTTSTAVTDYGFADGATVGFDTLTWDTNQVTYVTDYHLDLPLQGTAEVKINGVIKSFLTDYTVPDVATIHFLSKVLTTDTITIVDQYDTLISVVSKFTTTTAIDINALNIMVDNIQLIRNVDYTLTSAYQINFNTATVQILPSAYLQVFSQTTVADPAASFGWDDEYTITIEPAGTVVSLGFDLNGWDKSVWDNERTNTIAAPTYTLSRPVNNINNITVALNGVDLNAYYDYVLTTPTLLRLNPDLSITANDIVLVSHISEDSRIQNIEFRIFKGIADTYEYLAIGDTTTTTLSQDLYQTDEWIYVTDISIFSNPDPAQSKPGIVYINGERITFYILDIMNKRLGQLRRGTQGTGTPVVHDAGLRVYDGGSHTEIPESRDQYTVADQDIILISKKGNEHLVQNGQIYRRGKLWLDPGKTTPANGTGILNSNTIQAKFLKAI